MLHMQLSQTCEICHLGGYNMEQQSCAPGEQEENKLQGWLAEERQVVCKDAWGILALD